MRQVQDYAEALEGQVKMGDAIRGYYTYDSSTADSQPLDTVGQYLHNRAPFGVSIEIGPLIFQSDPINVMFGMGILNNHNGEDSYSWSSYNNLDLQSGLTVEHISWVLYDWSCRALSSDALPTNAPILENWELNDLLITLGEKGGAGYIQATVTSVEIVPEPSSAVIMAIGALLLRRRRYGKLRRQQTSCSGVYL